MTLTVTAHCQLSAGKLIHIFKRKGKKCSHYAENNMHYCTKFMCPRFLHPIIIYMKTTIFWEVMSCSLAESLSEFTSQLANEFNIDLYFHIHHQPQLCVQVYYYSPVIVNQYYPG